VLQPVKTKHWWRRKEQIARSEIGLDHCSASRRRGLPDGERLLAWFGLIPSRPPFDGSAPN
jgi:hypothetical protein